MRIMLGVSLKFVFTIQFWLKVEVVSIITGPGSATGKKLILGLQATITLEVVPFCVYSLFTVLLPFFRCILEDMFPEAVQHRLGFCLDHVSCQNGVLSVLSSIGETEKSRVGGDDSHVVFGHKFPGEKGSVRLCCHDATASSFVTKVCGESSHIFMQSL
jgi:hypothetical protein